MTEDQRKYWLRSSRRNGDEIQLGRGSSGKKGRGKEHRKSPVYKLVTRNPIIERQKEVMEPPRGHFWPVAWVVAIDELRRAQTLHRLALCAALVPLSFMYKLITNPLDTIWWLMTPMIEAVAYPPLWSYFQLRNTFYRIVNSWDRLAVHWVRITLRIGRIPGMNLRRFLSVAASMNSHRARSAAAELVAVWFNYLMWIMAFCVEVLAFAATWALFYPVFAIVAFGWILFGVVMVCVHAVKMEYAQRRARRPSDVRQHHDLTPDETKCDIDDDEIRAQFLEELPYNLNDQASVQQSPVAELTEKEPPDHNTSETNKSDEAETAETRPSDHNSSDTNNHEGEGNNAHRPSAVPEDFRQTWLWSLRNDLSQLVDDPVARN